jgi:hypothetical protein
MLNGRNVDSMRSMREKKRERERQVKGEGTNNIQCKGY